MFIYPFLPKFELLHIKNSLFFGCFFKYITYVYILLYKFIKNNIFIYCINNFTK